MLGIWERLLDLTLSRNMMIKLPDGLSLWDFRKVVRSFVVKAVQSGPRGGPWVTQLWVPVRPTWLQLCD